MVKLTAQSAEETHALGVRLGRVLKPCSVLCLSGDLGTGKTTLTKGIGEGLGIPDQIQSPTYGLIHFHEGGRLPLWHADLYRIEAEDELEQIGLEEAMLDDGVVVVEWGERFPACLPAHHITITITEEPLGRMIEFRAMGAPHAAILADAFA